LDTYLKKESISVLTTINKKTRNIYDLIKDDYSLEELKDIKNKTTA
jgi:hypothetical protein